MTTHSRRELANAIRALSMDAVQRAKSGHPGMPMGMADIAEVVWREFMRVNPKNPQWMNRDRFVLSNGHGCMLLYSALHLAGFDVSMDDIKNFRQLHSKTPGHPEFGDTPGVESTTGPLGQGIAQAVGMAIAERHLAAQFNRPNHNIIDHYTYVFTGDGCLMEGVSHEASSLAGTLGLGKLIVFYDDNGISIDGEVQPWFSEDVAARYEAYGWHVIRNVDGHNSDAIKAAIIAARKDLSKPTLIQCKTVIGWGAPNAAGGAGCHGAPLGDEEIAAARKQLGWQHAPFEMPESIYQEWDLTKRGERWQHDWQSQFDAYAEAHPELANELQRRIKGALPSDWQNHVNDLCFSLIRAKDPANIATRKASQCVLDEFTKWMPELFGGSADLTGSNLTQAKGQSVYTKETPEGTYLHYGVREFGMFAIMVGMSLHGGVMPYGGTFLTFVDYGRNAVRLAAMMKQRVVFVLTHDSIGLGEDGPTHQPVEHAALLRSTPNVHTWRPADHLETLVAWEQACSQQQTPSCLLLTRQSVPALTHQESHLDGIRKGAYVLSGPENNPDCILIATGSEVQLAVAAAEQLQKQGWAVRVVSMPCMDLFKAQDVAYQQSVLPSDCKARVSIEAGTTDLWHQFVGDLGATIGIDSYGASAPAPVIFKEKGFTVENVIEVTKSVLSRCPTKRACGADQIGVE